MISEETYTSSLHTHVHFRIYEPKIVLRIKAVLFVHHDLGEDLERYDHFAKWMQNKGYVVVVSDFAGHGRSLIDFEQGYFGEGDAMEGLLKDMHHLQQVIMPRYPEALHFYIGMGFGASLIRLYATRFGDFFQGMILLSPAHNISFSHTGTLRFQLEKMVRGSRYRAEKRMEIIRRRFAKKVGKNQFDYLTSNQKEIELYEKDTVNNFPYTAKGFLDVLHINKMANLPTTIEATPDYLSIYLLSGKDDPVTRFGKDAQKIYEDYRNRGIKDLTIKVYEKSRHALMKEKNKIDVYNDIYHWLEERCFY